jgi:hypothetical protein
MLDEFTCLISVPVNSRARVWGELGRCLKKPSFPRHPRPKFNTHEVAINYGWTKSLRDSCSLVSFGRCVLDTTTCRGGRGAMAGMRVCDRAVDMRR